MDLPPELTDEQIRFLRHHKIEPSAALDAVGLRPSQYKVELKLQNKAVALVGETCDPQLRWRP